MADKATGSLSASVFQDEVKSTMSGSSIYEPKDANDKWVFAEVAVGNGASTNLLSVASDTEITFLGSGTELVAGDYIEWIAIKNISTTATEGVGIDFNAGTAAFDLKTTMIIGAGEMFIAKVPNATVEDVHARSCVMDGTYGYAESQGATTVTVQVAAIIDDVS